MDLERIRELLPFYANGTISPEERQLVDDALASIEDLRKELHFWQHAAEYLHGKGEHLSAQQIVDHARGTLPGNVRAAQDQHLALCPECSDLFRQTQASLSSLAAERPATSLTGYRRSIWKYAVAAAVAFAVILVIVRDAPPLHQDLPGPQPTPAPVVSQTLTIASLTLTYQPMLRSSGNQRPTLIALQKGDSLIRLRFAIPRTTVEGLRYSLWRELDQNKGAMIAEGLVRSGRGEIYDTVAVDVNRSNLPAPHQQLRLIIREELPPGASELTPEEYGFDLRGQPVP
jgi:hypothetical protein